MPNAYGLPDDSGGANVNPQVGSGSVQPPFSAPAFATPAGMPTAPSMAEGGVIPDDEYGGEASPNTDVTDYSGAMEVVRSALAYGRSQHGLPGSKPQEDGEEETAAIPEEEDSYEEGGYIEDDAEAAIPEEAGVEAVAPEPPPSDDSGMGPVAAVPDDNSGMGPVASVAPPDEAQTDGTMPSVNPMGDATGGARTAPPSIISYLQRATAMPEAQAEALERSVSGGGGGIGSDAMHDRNATVMKAVVAAPTEDDKFNYLQRNAKRYEADLALAHNAAVGTQNQGRNLNTAAARATAAFTNVPDALNVKFAYNGHGVTAMVQPLDSPAGGQRFDLSPEQFAELTKNGGAGHWDKITSSGGVVGALQQLAGGQQAQTEAAQGAAPRRSDAEAMRATGTNRSINMGRDVTLLRSPEYDRQKASGTGNEGDNPRQNLVRVLSGPRAADGVQTYQNGQNLTPTAQDQALERIRARGEGKGRGGLTADDRIKIEDHKTDNAIRKLEADDKFKTGRLEKGAGSREAIAAAKLEEFAKNRDAANGRNDLSNKVRLIGEKIKAGQKLDGGEQAVAKQILAPRAPQAPAAPQPNKPQAQAAPQAQTQSPQDQAAIMWARANPNDPRAAKIMQLHGVQ